MIGVEYIVPADVFEAFPPEEQKLWHSHAYEVSYILLLFCDDLCHACVFNSL